MSGEKGPDAARAAELRAMGQVVVRQCVHMLGHLTQAAPEPVQVVCGLGLATTAAFVDDETQASVGAEAAGTRGRVELTG